MVEVSGGVDGFVNYLTVQSRKVKSKRAAMLIAYGIGILIFIDGLLSIMFTGVVTRPLIDYTYIYWYPGKSWPTSATRPLPR